MVASAKPNPFNNSNSFLADADIQRLLLGRRLLVVDPDPAIARLVARVARGTQATSGPRRSKGVQTSVAQKKPTTPVVLSAPDLPAARKLLKQLAAREGIDLLVADADCLSDDWASFLEDVAQLQPEARVVFTTSSPSLDLGVAMMRHGALDYLPKPLKPDRLALSLKNAAARRHMQVHAARRLVRLKSAVRQLNQARRTVGQKVDLLCADLVNAYSDVAKQVEQVRVGEHLRKLLQSSADLEQLLCHLMDWLLREIGNCNIAIYLTDEAGKSELGAYMKHSVAGEAPITGWLAEHIIPRSARDGFFHGGPEEWGRHVSGEDVAPLLGQTMMAVDCPYLAESLGTVVVFRRSEKPFTAAEMELVKAAGPVFALALTNLVRKGQDGPESQESGTDDEQWWKRGDEAPF